VLLPNNERTVGKLEHYSLHYNVALVSVKKYNVDCPVKLESKLIRYDKMVVAVGRCFESGLLSAASGKYIQNYEVKSDLDCQYLWYTTCKTTKVAPLPFLFLIAYSSLSPTCLGLRGFVVVVVLLPEYDVLSLTYLASQLTSPYNLVRL
jgi:hypothetical protein